MTKLKHLNQDKTKKIKLGQNSKTNIVTKLKNSNCEEKKVTTQIVIKLKKNKL